MIMSLGDTPILPAVDPVLHNIRNEDIDKILRGELSAVESYHQIMDKVEEQEDLNRLRKFEADHIEAVNFWQEQARNSSKIPETTSGVWGSVVEAIMGTSKFFGDRTAVATLRNGEEHGLKLYQEMLQSEKLNASQKRRIENIFIPTQKEHIESMRTIEEHL